MIAYSEEGDAQRQNWFFDPTCESIYVGCKVKKIELKENLYNIYNEALILSISITQTKVLVW